MIDEAHDFRFSGRTSAGFTFLACLLAAGAGAGSVSSICVLKETGLCLGA